MTDIPKTDTPIQERTTTTIVEHLLIRDVDTNKIIVNQKEVSQRKLDTDDK